MRPVWQVPLQDALRLPAARRLSATPLTRHHGSTLKALSTLCRAHWRTRWLLHVTHPRMRTARDHVSTYSTLISRPTDSCDRANHWLKTLQDGYRVHSIPAIATIWKELRSSGDTVPMQGSVADELWKLLLQDHNLHDELFDYALLVKSTSGIIFDKLYEYLIRRLLQHAWNEDAEHNDNVLKWHQRFLDKYFIRPGSLNELVHVAKLSRSNLSLLRSIYRRGSCLPRQGIYDKLVPELCKMNEWQLALDWHFFLYSQRDFPRNSSFLRQGFKVRPTFEHAISDFVTKHIDPDALSPSSRFGAGVNATDSKQEVFNPASLAHIGDEELKKAMAQMDEKPRHAPLSDEFCARLVATKSFSISSVVNYFEMFDHGKLGPLALRELMARSYDLDDAIENLKAFQDAGIAIGLSVYPTIIKKFLDDRQFDLLQNLVQSDLHPETLHDYHLQCRLLRHYVQKKDRLSARRTLEIIRLMNPLQHVAAVSLDPATAIAKLLETHDFSSFAEGMSDLIGKCATICDTQQPDKYQMMVDDRLAQGLSFQGTEFKILSKFEASSGVEKRNLELEGNMLLRLLKSRHSVPPWLFKSIIGRLGGAFQLQQAFRLFQFIVGQYYVRPQFAQQSIVLGTQNDRMTDPWDELTTFLQPRHAANYAVRHNLHLSAAAFVEWGAKAAIPTLLSTETFHSWPSEVFFAGLRFVSELGCQGFMTDQKTIAATVNKRLLMFCGPGYSRRNRNNIIKLYNYFTLEEMLVAVEQVWSGDRLFPELYHMPGMPIDRTPQPKAKYYDAYKIQKESKSPLIFDSVPSPLEHVQADQPRSQGPWVYQKFDVLREQYGGSMLDGLIFTPAQASAPAIPRDERIKRRVHLRYLFFGTSAPQNFDTEQIRWHDHIQNSAIEADNSLVRAGMCKTE